MALPDGVSTFTLTFGAYRNAVGRFALGGRKAKLFPVDATGKPIRVLHTPTGMVIVPEPVTVKVNAEGTASVGPLPHTDNTSLSPLHFRWKLEWVQSSILENHPEVFQDKMFAAPASVGATVDYDRLGGLAPDGTPPVVTDSGTIDLSGYALKTDPRFTDARTPTEHSHTGYSSTTHTHADYAPTAHTHAGYAAADHSHSVDALTDGQVNRLFTSDDRVLLHQNSADALGWHMVRRNGDGAFGATAVFGLETPETDDQAAPKGYVDSRIDTHQHSVEDITGIVYYTDERAQDAAAGLLTHSDHDGISFAYDDATNKLNATVTAVGSTPSGSISEEVVWRIDVDQLDMAPAATGPLVIPDHTGTNELTHPAVVFVPEGFGGFRYWLAHTPYPNFADWEEDPNLAVSDDGTNWYTPPGVTNPLDDQGGSPGDHGSDPDLVYKDGTMYLIFRVNDDDTLGSDRYYYRSSTDGRNWTPRVQFFGPVPGRELVAQAILWDRGKWRMWNVDAGGRHADPANNAYPMLYWEADELTGPWSEPVVCNFPLPGDYRPWHQSVSRVGAQYVMLANTQTPSDYHASNIIAAESFDGISWRTSGNLIPRVGPHHDHLYHATFLPTVENGEFGLDVWYSAFDQAADPQNDPSIWSISRTRIPFKKEAVGGAVEDSGWIPVEFVNGWTQAEMAYGVSAVRKLGSRTEFRGEVRGGGYGTTAFWLPAGFEPAQTREMIAVGFAADWSPVMATVAARADGQVRVAATGPTPNGIVLAVGFVND